MSEKKCPLFSEKLEKHMVEVGNGLRPNAGNFCDYCFHPVELKSSTNKKCENCKKNITKNNVVDAVPNEIFSKEVKVPEKTIKRLTNDSETMCLAMNELIK